MNILILGGSGILSADFTKKTLDMKNNVYMVNRGTRKSFIDSRANLIVSDIRKESIEDLRKKINIIKYDVVIDFLSFAPSQLLKTLAVIQDNFIQYVFISTATVYKVMTDSIITEESEIGNKNWDYAWNKYLCEKKLHALSINYTIIRPYVTYGKSRIPFPIIPDGYHYSLIERIVTDKPILLYNGGEAICTLTNALDFAELLYRCLLNHRTYREHFHITSSFQQTWNDVYRELCNILGMKENSISVNENQIKKYMPEFHSILVGDKGRHMRFDNSKILRVVGGYNFKINLSTGLRESVNFFQKNAEMQGIDFGWDGRCDYLISHIKDGNRELAPPKVKNEYSNGKWKYYINRMQPTRWLYDKFRQVKNMENNGKLVPYYTDYDSLYIDIEPGIQIYQDNNGEYLHDALQPKPKNPKIYQHHSSTRYKNVKIGENGLAMSWNYRQKILAETDKPLPELYSTREECCGCSACYAICPMATIFMEEDEEGFSYPVVDAAKCIRCYKCCGVCPIKIVDQKI